MNGMSVLCVFVVTLCVDKMLIKKFDTTEEEGKKTKSLAKNVERTCTDPCLSAGVRLPSVPCLGTSGHAATPPPLFVYLHKTVNRSDWESGGVFGFGSLMRVWSQKNQAATNVECIYFFSFVPLIKIKKRKKVSIARQKENKIKKCVKWRIFCHRRHTKTEIIK
jgi:hypothetical protein